jgi:phage host-nuclease inhibitor protein Gam
MATKQAVKIKQAAAEFVPQDREQVVGAIAEIGRRQRERERIQAKMNDHLAAIKEEYEEEARPHNEKILKLSEGVKAWCEAHREELCQGGKIKTANLSSGEISWRLRPKKVVVKSAEKILEALKSLGLDRFIRVKEELNKDAILAEPEAVEHVKGISISQGEDFVIKPFETTLEELV